MGKVSAPPGPERFTARLRSRSPRATESLGKRLGRMLEGGDVVALVGDLGAGKTRLVRGLCAGALVPPSDVASPSFAIVSTYRGRLTVHHADLYRIADEDELFATGFGDLAGAPSGALVVEWADRVPWALPRERLTVTLAHDARAASVRHVSLEGVGARHACLARALARPAPRPNRRAVARTRRSTGRARR